jgi:ATP-dependent helicase/nuclease subunit A
MSPESLKLPDARSRDLIRTALDENILVEAGAGSGKTTELVNRMVALVRSGVDVERLAAVTFTRKAAGELRERFQDALEAARRETASDPDTAQRLDRALRSMDRAFMGTIHAFCARLLRERPLEAGLDPAFRELTAQEATLLAGRWWSTWLERLAADEDPALGELDRVGIRPEDLRQAFERLGERADVDFPHPPSPAPDPADVRAVRAELEHLMDEANRILPPREPDAGWDPLQKALRTAWFHRRVLDWQDDRVFLDILAQVLAKADDIVQNRWGEDGHFTAKVLKHRFEEWAADGSPASGLVSTWLAHRYPVALGFALRAAKEFAGFRRRTGQLSFHDLLVIAAELLRGSPAARADLGGRYGRLLVDEFQDTDPLQAEILFLLTSDPAEDRPDDWMASRPRAGALFVVGDPKQSIYRFRRADIALYQQVRARFQSFGRVLSLTASFRSLPGIAAVVNDVFRAEEHFPAEATNRQAAFAPLDPVRAEGRPAAGVYVYDIPASDARFHSRPREERPVEAAVLAGWIADRTTTGERDPGDFLILTRTKRDIELYAKALEERNLPVDVSGAGVGIEEEVRELEIVLDALTDPDDPVKTVGALTGLFFGLDLDQLLRWKEGGEDRRFDLRTVPPLAERGYAPTAETEPVRAALGTLHRWWERAKGQPSDIVVSEIVEELALVPFAAAGPLGQVRAGALGFLLDAVRTAGLEGDTSLVAALEAFSIVLTDDEAEAPLEPGREQAVRLMNLHKAKGLEAPVVVLANPYVEVPRGTREVVERGADGRAVGRMSIGIEEEGYGNFRQLARPLGWEADEESELRFELAEEVRLLYVAATRARDELLVMRPGGTWARKSPWSPFHAWLDEHATPLALEPPGPIRRERLEVPAAEMDLRVLAAAERLGASAAPSYSFDTVSALAHRPDAERIGEGEDGAEGEVPVGQERLPWATAEADSTGPGGFQWGSAVHAVLEAAGRGLVRDALRAAARTALVENDRPLRDGEPVELGALLALVDRVRSSELWTRAEAAEIRLVEQPFVLAQDEGRYLEGVIDLVFREEDGWIVVDYKTDRGDAPDFAERMKRYREQVGTYASAWARITGDTIAESLVWTLADAPG